MSDFLSFRNTGLVTIGDKPLSWKGRPRSVIILGVARSGTSLVSGSLHNLGVFTGDRSIAPTFEDLRLSEAIESNSWIDVDRILNDYYSRHIIWGYKRPVLIQSSKRPNRKLTNLLTAFYVYSKLSGLKNIITLHKRLVNPLYVITFKDMLSIANRSSISSNADMIDSLKRTLVGYRKLFDFIIDFSPNALLVSYEKAVANKKWFIEALVDFCQIEPSGAQIDSAMNFVTSDPKNYLDVSRTNKAIGHLDKVSREEVLGWARYLNNERTAEVTLLVDGREVQKVKANLFRKDLLENKVHSKGTCAFAFKGLDSSLLNDESEVRVKVVDDRTDLKNSPFVFRFE
jgi:hypothetical protein